MADTDNAPQNPLLQYKSYTTKNILVAFTTTSDAVNTKIDYTLGETGTQFNGTGCDKPAIVVVNEFVDYKFSIVNHQNEFSFHSFFDRSTSSMTGSLTITDSVGGYFQNFMRDQVAIKLGIAQSHVVFALKTWFIGTTKTDEQLILSTKPLIFHMINLTHSFNDTGSQNFYSLMYVADYNTFGLLPNFSRMFQMTVTHKDSGQHAETPIVSQSTDLIAKRKQLESYRSKRITNDKTMMNIRDVMEGFEAGLKNMKFAPKSQLQSWMGNIRSDYVNKIEPYDQKKSGGELPIEYNIHLDSIYDNYVIDNRNLTYEQPEQSQVAAGIKSFQVKPGKSLTATVNNLMKLSSQVGEDARVGLDMQKSYKCNMSTIKTCDDKYQFDVHIAHYIVPKNTQTVDTGPGNDESFLNPLIFTYQESAKDRDIINISTSMFSDSDLSILEQPNTSNDNRVVVGNREQITVERSSSAGFFNTSFSGVRGMADPKNYSLERPNGPVSIDNLVKTNLSQTSRLYITIVGNPNLLSDLFRNPQKVVDEDEDSPFYYKYPEYYPMYAKLNLYLKPSSSIGIENAKDIPNQYYYTGYYHLGKVTTNITGNLFTQVLELYRTDDQT